jgi:hypothetical protein
VTGDSLVDFEDSAAHVLASVENLLATIRNDFSSRAEHELRSQLQRARVFLAGIDQPLDGSSTLGQLSIGQLKHLLSVIEKITDRPAPIPARPVYDKTNLVLAVTAAARAYHRNWRARLGVTSEADVVKEHWSRVKALSSRYADGRSDQYDTLRPAADLRELLKEEIYRTLEAPLKWTGQAPSNKEEVTAVINEFAQSIAARLPEPIRERLSKRPLPTWQGAAGLAGRGSTYVRARVIADDIFMRNVPIPTTTPSPDQNDFLHAVLDAVVEAANETGVELV